MQPKSTFLGRALRRRKFLVRPQYQLRVGAMSATVALLLLLFLNVSLYLAGSASRDAMARVAPELSEFISAQDRVQLVLMVAGSLVFLGGVFVISILESHKTAGAAYNIERRIREVQVGRYGTKLKLRRGDNLRELESAFNDMAEALRQRTERDIGELTELAERARGVGGQAGQELADRLHGHVEECRKRLS